MTWIARSLVATSLVLLVAGCQEFSGLSKLSWPFSDPDEEVVENAKAAINGEDGHSRFVGDYITVRRGLQMFVVEGVGLVTGLQGTGSDDGPPFREIMLDDMRRRRFPRPEEFLRSPDTCLVLVRAYIPPLVRQGDRLDVELRVPEGSSTSSLQGGTLLECHLTEVAYAAGRGRMEGRVLAKAIGPILGPNIGETDDDGQFLVGQIPGGAVYVGEDRDLSVSLKRDYANYRMSTRIAKRIGERFFDYDRAGIQRPLAEAKTHSRIDVQVHSRYRDNYPRYLQCIRNITLKDSAVERNLRMQQVTRQLLVGPTAAQAAIQLEAIGREAIPFLKAGLKADNLESRFYSAEALAYLGDTSGVKVLRETAEQEPAFRVYALAGLSATMSPESLMELQSLFNHDSTETRYGAFRAYTNIAPKDRSVEPLDVKGSYSLHVVDSSATPFVHVTQRRKSEVVLFGGDQQVVTPVFLRAGRHILIRSKPTGDQLVVTHIVPGQREERKEISTQLAELILTVDQFGAEYPDLVQML
ncbi:MAG: flagellar basal body P-ring protein FlgI, partial [Planctomycetaceae bacterium]|nr:flagellar basal body P-ring protein FlgI [Planctomycetaceae bacterium]